MTKEFVPVALGKAGATGMLFDHDLFQNPFRLGIAQNYAYAGNDKERIIVAASVKRRYIPPKQRRTHHEEA